MMTLQYLIESGQLFTLILIGITGEALLLAWLSRRHSRAYIKRLGPNLCAGAALMFGIQLAITDSSWTAIAGTLTIALSAHILDVYLRLHEAC